MCLCNWDGMFFNNSCLCHLWLKIIPSRLLRHFRATTREGNLYHHSCYARNVPYLVPNYIFPQFRFQNFYHGWVASLVQQNLGFLQKQLQVIVEELPIRLLKLKMKYNKSTWIRCLFGITKVFIFFRCPTYIMAKWIN